MGEKLLSICVPTYNRAEILRIFLGKLQREFETINVNEIDLLVSDNCSTDNTEDVVKSKIDEGMPINYIRNVENLGMDGNFVQCFKKASAKYVWVIGDDDLIKSGSLGIILNQLKADTYGLIHLRANKFDNRIKAYNNYKEFLEKVTYYISFISSNIVATKFVKSIDFDKYTGTYFTLIPLYITAAQTAGKNLIIGKQLLDTGADAQRNGGYNYFEVFVSNYLSIRKEYFGDDLKSYEKEKKKIFDNHILIYIYKLLIKKEKGNFKTEGGWKIVLSHFGLKTYFYCGMIQYGLKHIKNIKGLFRY